MILEIDASANRRNLATQTLGDTEKVMLSRLLRLVRPTRPTMTPQQWDDSEDLSWLNPPANPPDGVAWDRFWQNHIEQTRREGASLMSCVGEPLKRNVRQLLRYVPTLEDCPPVELGLNEF